MKKVELLAPAGDLERLKYAINYGADAVYIGGYKYGLRANATNFSIDNMKEAISYAHERNRKIYVTVNITLHNDDLTGLLEYLKELDSIKVDAIIVSDPYIIELAHNHTNLEIHVSTQASTLNIESCKYMKSLGCSRIVLGREARREEIKEIIDNVDIELETFIHGAMCAGYSGRCVLSNHLTARDANRGGCAQICRWDFDLYDDNKLVEGDKPFTFCSKDLSMVDHIEDMIDLGITSFKIEGRMRSIYYIATVVSVYRKIIDAHLNGHDLNNKQELKLILNRVANRDSAPQFYVGNYDNNSQYYNGREEVSNQDFLGVVVDYKNNIVTMEQRNYFKPADKVTIFGPNTSVDLVIPDIYNIDMEQLEVARHPREIIKFKLEDKVNKGDLMRIKI